MDIATIKDNYVRSIRILKIIDGDTVKVSLDLGFKIFLEQNIRLEHVYAEEMKANDAVKKQSAQEHKEIAANLLPLSGMFMMISKNKYDNHGRVLATIFDAKTGESINKKIQDAIGTHVGRGVIK